MKVGVFPEAFLRAMSAEDRRAIGQPTMAEAERQYERGQEKELKRDVLNWLNLQGAWVFTQRMDKRTRGKRGVLILRFKRWFRTGALCGLEVDLAEVRTNTFRPHFVWNGRGHKPRNDCAGCERERKR
jgi:hypothetical protein